MAFQQGLSGLASSSRAIDVTSNNIANTSTVGFKAGQALFADIYAATLVEASSNLQVGIGSSTSIVRQTFTQGSLSTSNNPLDLAINGNGFFRVQRNDGTVAYSRNGQFDIDRDGFIVNANGDKLTGFRVGAVVDGQTVFEGVPGNLMVDVANIEPRATSQGVSLIANLDARESNMLSRVPPGSNFDPAKAPGHPIDSYNATTSLKVFDSLGNAHSLTLYFVRPEPDPDAPELARAWLIYPSLNGDTATPNADPETSPWRIDFDELGRPTGAMSFEFTRTLTNGAAPLKFPVDLRNLTQFGSPFSVTSARQDGYTTGQLSGVVTTAEGVVQGRYSNGETKNIGRIALAHFQSPNGLRSLGNNLWAESPDSGQPTLGGAGTGLLGTISTGTVEESNVDLTRELVNLIIQQRNYQANAQSIRTQDQMLQTVVNLR